MIDHARTHPVPTRRAVLAGGSALALAVALPGSADANGTEPVGRTMRERVTAWLSILTEQQTSEATFAFDSRTRRRWNYMLGSSFGNGLALENMAPSQKDAALVVLASGLSATGLETAKNIMLQQDILRDEWGKGRPDRNSERFQLMVFGTPSATEPWGWRFEGHHLTITFTLVGDRIISQTPKAFSSEPNTVPSGPYRGLVVLENEALGRALFTDLSPQARRAALIRERSYGNILAKPGREDAVTTREGVALGDLTTSQADTVRRMVALYTHDHLAAPVAEAQRARLAVEDEGEIRFAWSGPNVEGESLYYRIHGATFLIEFATLHGQPEHHHTIVHDLKQNFGDHLLG